MNEVAKDYSSTYEDEHQKGEIKTALIHRIPLYYEVKYTRSRVVLRWVTS